MEHPTYHTMKGTPPEHEAKLLFMGASMWMLVLVTAFSSWEYQVVPMTSADTISECHFRATQVDFDITRNENQELLCIRVDEENEE